MSQSIAAGTWVEVHAIMLAPEDRAPQVPPDTRQVPLEMKTKGFLVRPASVGQDAEIVTAAGRHVHGMLCEVNPAYTHSFGAPVPELSAIGPELRTRLRDKGSAI